jgi:hypothetical protein
MGNGLWSPASYHSRVAESAKLGKDVFDYSVKSIQSGRMRPHQTLDPQGLGIRESRDSEEHPESNAIIISLDVTGSMGRVVRGIHGDLPRLHELLLGHRYVPHPQIMFAAVGDATCDRVPLQVGQFESDNRMDEQLGRILLEGGGGGQKTESYELAMYFMARHTTIDCYEKRGRRGYLFIIGDELAYPQVKSREVAGVVGDDLREDVPLRQIVDELTRRWDTYYLLPAGSHYSGNAKVLDFWRDLLGQNAVVLDDLDAVCETIALTVGLGEQAIDLDEGLRDLDRAGSGASGTVSKALARLRGGRRAEVSTLPAFRDTGGEVPRL